MYFLSLFPLPWSVTPDELPIDASLNRFIRTKAHLTGTKFMCLEGGCGVCIVNVVDTHPVTKQRITFSVNSVSGASFL